MRVLLSVGCNSYKHASQLRGAEADATSIFNALAGTEIHQYDPAASQLSLSPTGEELRHSLARTLYSSEEISVFTFYFAGHGVVFDETLYLATTDTNPKQIALTGIGFTELLRAVLGARPKQANFILDACNTGGLGFDLAAILKRTIVGAANTTGISFVAAAAAEESALETTAGGAFTVQFTKAIRGDAYIQRTAPFLNLVEIAQHLQTHAGLSNQTISAWGLNLQGPNLFAKNPFYSGPEAIADTIVSKLQKNRISKDEQIKLRTALAKIVTELNEKQLAATLEEALANADPQERVELLFSLIEGLRPELSDADDAFLEARVTSIFLGQLISNDAANEILIASVKLLIDSLRRALGELIEAMIENELALVNEPISDLYHLPIRVSDTLGHAGLFVLAQPEISDSDLSLATKAIFLILKAYGSTIVALSDDQACGFLVFLAACERYKWTEWAEEIIGRLYCDIDRNFGRVASNHLDAASQVKVLEERYEQIEKPDIDLYESPSDLVTMTLTCAAQFNLDEAIDLSLINLDHTNINFFVPDVAATLGSADKIPGTNYSLSVGHDFWRCIDLRRIVQADIFPIYSDTFSDLIPEARTAILASSLVFRDRLPWKVWSSPEVS